MEPLLYFNEEILELEMCPVGTRMSRQVVMSVTQNEFGETI